MPEVSRFYGIIIKMFFNDHSPSHFHAEYGNYKAMIAIESGDVLEGDMPKKQLKLIQAWAILHEDELLENFKGLSKLPVSWRNIEPLR
jgi:uncharacterized protein DUF4160